MGNHAGQYFPRFVQILAVFSATLAMGACGDALPEIQCLNAEDCDSAQFCVENQCVSLAEIHACPTEREPRDGAAIGELCGTCGTGIWQCGPSGFVCEGDQLNACGGCSADPGILGRPCDSCGGTWACNGTDVVCAGGTTNACGGCESLTPAGATPGFVCPIDPGQGRFGIWSCASLRTLRCRAPEENACGGNEPLPGFPGDRCGACDGGVLACRGEDALQCCRLGSSGDCEPWDSAGLDPCGTCRAPEFPLEPRCEDDGAPAPTLDCDAGKQLCESARNACGGLLSLPQTPGTPCTGGFWACTSPDSLACIASTTPNACGGSMPLPDDPTSGNREPGERCGPCGDGVLVCAGPDTLQCQGGSPLNACGGCGPLPALVGAPCAPRQAWSCYDDPQLGPSLQCGSPDRNGCGGVTPFPQLPGAPCGECGGRSGCDVASDTIPCVVSPENAARPFYPDADNDGYGDRFVATPKA
jgi:hypothetical protein